MLLIGTTMLCGFVMLARSGEAKAAGTVELKAGAVSLAIDQTDRGLFAETIEISIGGEIVDLSGFRAVFRDGSTDFERAEWTVKKSRLLVRHHLNNGASFLGELHIDKHAGMIVCRFSGLDAVSHIESACLGSKVVRLYSDLGWVVENPSKVHNRPRLMTDFIVNERENGWAELLACDMGHGYRFNPDSQRCVMTSISAAPETTFSLGIGKGTPVVELVHHYRSTRNVSPPKTIDKLAGRFLFDDWTGTDTKRTIAQIEQMLYAGCADLLVLFHVWQQYGYDQKYPDVFPPNDSVGGVEGIKALAEYCKANNIQFGLHDNYSDIYPDGPSFSLDKTTSYINGKGERVHHRGWLNQGTGIQAYHMGGEAAIAAAEKNFDVMRKAFPLTTMFLDVTSYGEPYAYEFPAGVHRDPTYALEHGRGLYELARDKFGDAPVVGEGATEKYLGAVDAAGSDLWSADRWNADPGAADWEYYPLFNLAFHKNVILYGAGYQNRYKLPDADFSTDYYGEQACDDYRASRILMGNSGFRYISVLNQPFDTDEIIREYYLSVPLAKQIERVPIADISWEDGDIHRINVEYENGMKVSVNRGERPWRIGHFVLPTYGVLAKSDDFVQATFAMHTGRVDIVRTDALFFFDTRGRGNSAGGVAADGAVVINLNKDELIIRPLGHTRWLLIDFDEFEPRYDLRGARVDIRGYDGELLDSLALDSEKNAFEQLPKRLPVPRDIDCDFPTPPPTYYPHYAIKLP